MGGIIFSPEDSSKVARRWYARTSPLTRIPSSRDAPKIIADFRLFHTYFDSKVLSDEL
jgi:hypothetical protein